MTPRELVHRSFRSALARGSKGVLIPDCATRDDREGSHHAWVCDELTQSVAFDRLMVRNGHRDEPACTEPTPA